MNKKTHKLLIYIFVMLLKTIFSIIKQSVTQRFKGIVFGIGFGIGGAMPKQVEIIKDLISKINSLQLGIGCIGLKRKVSMCAYTCARILIIYPIHPIHHILI